MKGVFQKGDNWYISYSDAYGRRIRKMIGPDKKIAILARQKRLVEVAEGKHLDIKKNEKIKFADFAAEYLETHSKLKKSYHTDCKIAGLFKKTFSNKCLHEITSLDIEKFKTNRIKEVSPATVNRALAVLKSIFNKAIAWGKIDKSPFKSVKMFKENNQRLRFLEREEIPKLLDNCCPHLKPIVILALNTGMRKSEILGLKWHDVDFKRGTIHLHDTKGGESREVPINDTAKRALVAVSKHPDSPYIFTDNNGNNYGDIKKSFLTAVKKSGIINFHFHDLRHTFASQLVMAGVDLNTVRELLGHKSLEMTLRYSHLSPDHKKRAVDVLSRRMGPVRSPEPENSDTEKLTVSQLIENTVVA
jgi:integrase